MSGPLTGALRNVQYTTGIELHSVEKMHMPVHAKYVQSVIVGVVYVVWPLCINAEILLQVKAYAMTSVFYLKGT